MLKEVFLIVVSRIILISLRVWRSKTRACKKSWRWSKKVLN